MQDEITYPFENYRVQPYIYKMRLLSQFLDPGQLRLELYCVLSAGF